MSKKAHYDPNGWKQSVHPTNYSVKVYYLSYDGSKSLVADVFNVDKDILFKILDAYGNASFEIHIVNVKEAKLDVYNNFEGSIKKGYCERE